MTDNYKGQKFGRLTVIEWYTSEDKKAEVICDCGNKTLAKHKDLLLGIKTVCSKSACLLKIIDITGQIFGYWTVLNCAGLHKYDTGYTRICWNCRCICGTVKQVSSINLRTGASKSCGCKTAEMKSISHTKPNGEGLKYKIFYNYKKIATEKNLEFLLTKEKFYNMLNCNCYYCGSEPIGIARLSSNKTQKLPYNGIDRKDNTKGYTEENCVTCCKLCNMAKRNLIFEDFTKWINNLVNYQLGKKGD